MKDFLKDPYFDPRIGLNHKGVEPWDNRDYWGYIPTFEKIAESKRTDLHSGKAGRKWAEERIDKLHPILDEKHGWVYKTGAPINFLAIGMNLILELLD